MYPMLHFFSRRVAQSCAEFFSFSTPRDSPYSARSTFYCLLAALLLTTACERTIDLDLPAGEPQLVVQGHIEPGQPPVILLTESQPVFTPVSPQTLAGAFVHGAAITVSTRDSSFQLQEVSSDTLPIYLRYLLAEQTGLTLDPQTGQLPFTVSFYTTVPSPGRPLLLGRAGRTYNLRVAAGGRVLTANTSIPHPTPLDSLWFKAPPDPALADSLLVLWYRYRDPDTIGNAARYFTKVNREPYYTGRIQSVFTDEFVNGRQNVDFPLERGRPRAQQFEAARSGLFRKGDTITVRWCAIDQPHFRFWLSADNALNSNGSPLAAPASLATNIKGGLGIWGGYAPTYHRIIAPR